MLRGQPNPREWSLDLMPQGNRNFVAVLWGDEIKVAAVGFEEPEGSVDVERDQIDRIPITDCVGEVGGTVV